MSDLARFDFVIDAGDSLARAQAELATMPAKIARAQTRTMRAMATWLKRQILRAASQETGITQKALAAAARIKSTIAANSVTLWLGTNPISAHFLGRVTWTRKMQGARAGKRLFPHTWSWGEGSKTGVKIMRRTGHFHTEGRRRREGIAIVKVPIHDAMVRKLDGMRSEIATRYDQELRQQLNYALNVERRG